MGNLKIGDKIIVMKVLTSQPDIDYIIGEVLQIEFIDTIFDRFPFAVSYNGRKYWVEGVTYSTLMLELM